MASTENLLRSLDSREIGKEDLQLILSENFELPVTVRECETSSLLPPGENFACAIFKVKAIIKRDKHEDEEELHLVAKMIALNERIKEVFDFYMMFRKEIFFYEKLAPLYQQLQIDFGASDNERFDIVPKFYGVKRSVDPNSNKLDDGVILLMENLKEHGYYTLDKIQGLDLDHSKVTIKALAKFHALGIACKKHRPDFLKEIQEHAKIVPFKEEEGDIYELMYGMLCKDPRIVKYSEKIQGLMGAEKKDMFFSFVADEPWLSVVHLDFWTNNILYHKDEKGRVDDVKFIDFQNYAYNSPLRDLPYFLCSSTAPDVMLSHIDELLDLYFETFVETLRQMKCDTEPFSRESFEKQLKIDASLEFFHNILAIKFFYAEIDKNTYDPDQMESVIIFSDVNEHGYDKWYQIVMTYLKMGWL